MLIAFEKGEIIRNVGKLTILQLNGGRFGGKKIVPVRVYSVLFSNFAKRL